MALIGRLVAAAIALRIAAALKGPCGDKSGELQTSNGEASAMGLQLKNISDAVAAASTSMQASADALQPAFGKVGDSAAGASMQSAKVFAGTLEHAAEEGQVLVGAIKGLSMQTATIHGGGMASLITQLNSASEKATESKASLEALYAKAAPAATTSGASALYYPIMYFVDKAFVDSPSTCGGTPAAEPIVGTHDECATACEALVGKCVGFGYYGSGSLCFLFSTFTSVTYYTGCGTGLLLQTTSRQLQSVAADATKCVAKFGNFNGVTLKPDPSGKCAGCLQEANNAMRCFQ